MLRLRVCMRESPLQQNLISSCEGSLSSALLSIFRILFILLLASDRKEGSMIGIEFRLSIFRYENLCGR